MCLTPPNYGDFDRQIGTVLEAFKTLPPYQQPVLYTESRISERMVTMSSQLGIEIEITDISVVDQLNTTVQRGRAFALQQESAGQCFHQWHPSPTHVIKPRSKANYSSLVCSHLKTDLHLQICISNRVYCGCLFVQPNSR